MLRPYESLSRFYDAGWSDFSRRYVSWIDELLWERGARPASILDLACGTGALAIELAQCGHSVRGMDISPEMIGLTRAKAAGLQNAVFELQDMVSFDTAERYDLVACTFDSINYVLKLRELRKMFFRIASVLKANGLFVFDSNTKHLYLRHSGETEKVELNGESFIQYCSYDAKHKIQTTAFSFPDGAYEVHRQRPYGYDELRPLLERAGFNIAGLYSWFNGMPYSPKTPKLFCVAEKRKQGR